MQTGAARLEVIAGKAVGTSIVVEDELVIGRHADGAHGLAGDDEISRRHARISLDSSGYLAIEDLGSTNGTFVNGLRIGGPKTLFEGDGIELGGTTLVVRELPALPVNEPSTPTQLQPTPARVDTPIQPLALRVEIDLAAREARILLDDASEPVRLQHADGAWRVVPPER